MKCEAIENCKRKVAYTVIDHKVKKVVNLCEAHFSQGMKAWLEPNLIIKHLVHEGVL